MASTPEGNFAFDLKRTAAATTHNNHVGAAVDAALARVTFLDSLGEIALDRIAAGIDVSPIFCGLVDEVRGVRKYLTPDQAELFDFDLRLLCAHIFMAGRQSMKGGE